MLSFVRAAPILILPLPRSAGKQSSDGQCIRHIDPAGPAAQAGLQPGDRLLMVNGTDVMYWSHRKVVDEIRRSGDTIELLVGRAQAQV